MIQYYDNGEMRSLADHGCKAQQKHQGALETAFTWWSSGFISGVAAAVWMLIRARIDDKSVKGGDGLRPLAECGGAEGGMGECWAIQATSQHWERQALFSLMRLIPSHLGCSKPKRSDGQSPHAFCLHGATPKRHENATLLGVHGNTAKRTGAAHHSIAVLERGGPLSLVLADNIGSPPLRRTCLGPSPYFIMSQPERTVEYGGNKPAVLGLTCYAICNSSTQSQHLLDAPPWGVRRNLESYLPLGGPDTPSLLYFPHQSR
ncbi:hypothetical protein CHU98_g9525 [Xylaria longipes]|nr:hypothetical protein CHU98_g9525 [Xylaria longipes]